MSKSTAIAVSEAATDFTKFAPPSMIAGTVKFASGADPLAVAYHAAAFALDTERVRLVMKVVANRVHYLAADASDFASQGTDRPVGTALASILDRLVKRDPTAPPLALLEADDAGTTAVAYVDGELVSLRGYSALIEQQVKDRYGEVDIIDVTQEPAFLPWRGYVELQNQGARRVQRLSLIAGTVVASLAALGLVLVSVARGPGKQPGITEANDTLMHVVSDAVGKANAPVLSATYTFFEVQRLASLAADSGGRIVKFVQENNRIAWEIRVPTWVTQEMLTSLGGDIRVRREADALVVRRGILERDDETNAVARRADQDMARNVQQQAKP